MPKTHFKVANPAPLQGTQKAEFDIDVGSRAEWVRKIALKLLWGLTDPAR